MELYKILLLNCFLAFVFCQKLIMLNELFRHGARYPVYPKKDDFSNYTWAEHSFGELTTNGKKMHYLLGQQLYKQYWRDLFDGTEFFSTYNQSKFHIKSTDVNRTIESVQSQLMGLFENLNELTLTNDMTFYSRPAWPGINAENGSVFPTAKAFHPMAIHVQKGGSQPFNSGDFLRTYSPENCPNQNKWISENQQNERFKKILENENITKSIQALSEQLGRNITFWDAPAYFDNYECARYLGKKYFKVFDKPEYNYTLSYIHTLEMYINLYSNPKQIKATATGFFNQTVYNIKKRIANKDEVQWNIYSAHDTTVGNMLAALNLTNVECIYEAFLNNKTANSDTCVSEYPIYTSNLIFEIWEYNSTNHTFKIRYNGEIKKIPFCDWKLECPVQKLYDWYDSFKDEDYLSTCGVSNTDVQIYFSIAAAEFIIILCFILAALVSCLKKKMHHDAQASNSQKSTNPSQTGSSDPMIKDSLLTEQEKIA